MTDRGKVPIQNRLIVRLLGIHVVMAGVALVIVWWAINNLSSAYMATLLQKHGVSDSTSHQMFVESVHQYIIGAGLVSLFVGGALSFLMMRKTLRPLTKMTELTSRVAAGEYEVKVPEETEDEVGRLAKAFNTMADSLRKIEQLRKTMMIDVAHELRTPLTNVRGYLEALNDGVVPASHETYELLQEETIRLSSLVEDIMSLAKADAAKTSLNIFEFNLNEQIENILQKFQPKFAEKNLNVETFFCPGCERVEADPDKIQQVMTNLLQNACQYNIENGRIAVKTEMADKRIKIEVANTGGDIKKEDLPFIFERFYRAEKSRSRALGGAGIGLAIVKELIEAHGGAVGAETNGEMTEIWLSIPRRS